MPIRADVMITRRPGGCDRDYCSDGRQLMSAFDVRRSPSWVPGFEICHRMACSRWLCTLWAYSHGPD